MERLKVSTTSGIYQLKSKATGDVLYVGKANNLIHRKTQHIKGLENDTHNNPKLREHVKTLGVQDILFSVIEECDIKYLIRREKHFIKTLKPKYNLDGVVQKPPRSIESRKNMSKITSERYKNPEQRKKTSDRAFARYKSPNRRLFNNIQERDLYHNKINSLKNVLKRLEEYEIKKKELEKWFLLNTPEILKKDN